MNNKESAEKVIIEFASDWNQWHTNCKEQVLDAMIKYKANSLPSKDEIEQAIKELSKQSTAPDKETPDWMESDIRRGITWCIKQLKA